MYVMVWRGSEHDFVGDSCEINTWVMLKAGNLQWELCFRIYCHVSGVPWLIETGSGLYDWYINTFFYNLSYSQPIIALANLPTSQMTETCYPFPGNRFMTETITSNHYEVFLPFLVQWPWTTDPPELEPILKF
jgi:hypothetical protein